METSSSNRGLPALRPDLEDLGEETRPLGFTVGRA